jgi:protein-tyrosine phosphatase
MIDLHCHILPGIDDGPASLEDAVRMARIAVEDGIHTLVTTPHGVDWASTHGGDESDLRHEIAALQGELRRQELDLEILPGMEVHLLPETPSLYRGKQVFTLNSSRYILVEFPIHSFPIYAEDTLFNLQVHKLVPVIAHAERYSALAERPELLEQMVARGMLLQITAGSLMGQFGAQAREMAETLITRRMAHVMASDGHSVSRRPPILSGGLQRAGQLVGEDIALEMVTTVPAAILRNEEVTVPEPVAIRRRSWFPFGHRRP